jgi:periplasmic protein CpxP/Spy
MSFRTHRTAVSAQLARSVAIAALLSAALVAGPLTAARADGAATAPMQLAQAAAPQTAAESAATQAETIEQRITNLHAALKITPAEDAKWNNVAQAMRENVAAMQKLAAEKTTQAPQDMTAVQDLKNYQAFAQAHVDGLKNLISSFSSLYSAMPDAQKKVADQVFQGFGRQGAASKG